MNRLSELTSIGLLASPWAAAGEVVSLGGGDVSSLRAEGAGEGVLAWSKPSTTGEGAGAGEGSLAWSTASTGEGAALV